VREPGRPLDQERDHHDRAGGHLLDADPLLRLVAARHIDSALFVTHRFGLGEFLNAYDMFDRAAETGALKVVLSRH